MTRMIAVSFILLSACGTVPDFDGKISQEAKDATYPMLTPIPAPDQNLGKRSETAFETLTQRRARLEKRAEILRAGAADDPTRKKLARAH